MNDDAELTDLQIAILGVLWDRREASVADVFDALGRHEPVTRKTVATVLGRLAHRGIVAKRMEGKRGIYRALIARRSALIARLTRLLGAMFEINTGDVVPRMVDRVATKKGDATRLRKLLERAQQDLRKRG